MFIGEFRCQLWTRGRLVIPAVLRARIKPPNDHLSLSMGPEKQLCLYPCRAIDEPLGTDLKTGDEEGNGTVENRVMTIEADGCIALEEKDLGEAGLAPSIEVAIVSAGDHIEVWPADRWDRHVAALLNRHFGPGTDGPAPRDRRGS